MPPAPLTLRRWATRFLLAALAVALIVIGIGWFTDVRDAAHTALVSVLGFAFLPFVFVGIAGAILAVAVMCLVLSCLVGEPVDLTELVDAAGRTAGLSAPAAYIYYTYLSKQRHPAFWGLPAGALLGGAVLWGIVGLVILPGETRTLTALLNAQAHVEAAYAASKEYPEPDPAGHLTYDSITARGITLDPSLPTTGPILDGFGRPLLYSVEGKGRVAAYTLRSTGYDPSCPSDDLIVSGRTRLRALAGAKSALGELVEHLRRDTPTPVQIKFRALRDVRRGEH